MNFFERQHVARRNTRLMIVLFALAIIGIVIAVDLVAALAWILTNADVPRPRDPGAGSRAVLLSVPAWVYATGALATTFTILAVSLWNVMALRAGGGAAVATMVGARRLEPGSRDPLERRLLNVVEEMAIAAGTRVPAVYVMDEEPGINAFAAGYDVSNSIVAVTRGTLESLNRDELQGVIGHEFSHIVNGDMSLNIRMIGVLAGIVFLGAIGGFILRNASGRSKEGSALLMIGIGILVIGYIGLFFARLIKASVAREREFLADAASVQFTRNPDGLAGALDQIRATGRNSLITNRHAEDVSHLFFGEGIAMAMSGLFATHPPLEERIRRVNPRFQPAGYRESRPAAAAVTPADVPEAAMGLADGAPPLVEPELPGARTGDASQAWSHSPRESAGLVGSISGQKVDVAKRMLAAIPVSVRERVREPEGARATLVALMLAQKDSVMEEQLMAVKTAGAGALGEAARAVAREISGIGPAYYLMVVDLALPALKLASADDQTELLLALQAVIHADRRISMFEFVLFTLVRSQFSSRTGFAAPKYSSLAQAQAEVLFMLSLVAYAGAHFGPQADQEFETAFRAGAKEMGMADAKPIARGALGMEEAGAVLEKLRELAPLPKAVLVKGLFAAVTADGTIRVIEAAIMRAVGAVLDCPLPPLLEDLDPETLAP